MLHQLITAICGLTLQTQVNACSITLKQATVDYNRKVEQKLNTYKIQLENSELAKQVTNRYTASIFYVGKVVYDRRIGINFGNQSLSASPESLRWSFRLTF